MASSTSPLVQHHVDNDTGVHRIILDRPNARNAISQQLLSELEAALDDVYDACAAPSLAGAALAWTRDRRQAHKHHDHPSAAQLQWPTPPPSRRGSELHSTTTMTTTTSEPSLGPPSPPSSGPASIHEDTSPARCLIVQSSSAKAFCAGADLVERKRMSSDEVSAFLAKLRRVIGKLDDMPIPTIAAIDGPALGGGLELALACDFRTAAAAQPRRPIIGFPECQLAIIPGAGGTQRATRLLGVSRAKALILTGQLLDARQAFDCGLITHLAGHDDDDDTNTAVGAADRLATQLQRSAPLALAAAKAAIDVGSQLPDLESALDWEAACYRALLPTRDRQEALHAFAEKRKPHFVGQ